MVCGDVNIRACWKRCAGGERGLCSVSSVKVDVLKGVQHKNPKKNIAFGAALSMVDLAFC